MYDLVTGAGVVLGPAVGGFLVCTVWMRHRHRRQRERAAAAARNAVLQRTADLRRPAEWGPIRHPSFADIEHLRIAVFRDQVCDLASARPEQNQGVWFAHWLAHYQEDGLLSGVAG